MLNEDPRPSWLEKPVLNTLKFNWEHALYALIFLLAVFSRFYLLGLRVQSHDETSHVYFSWLYSEGNGYSHDPVTHGPFQFHVIGLTYYLFGDNDFTSRTPAAIFSIASVVLMAAFRRYLGRAGALIAAAMMLISPYMLYYGRYARNEAFIMFFGPLMLWAMLRYFDEAKPFHLLVFTAAISLHFTSKETSFIYAAQALIFLALVLGIRLVTRRWPNPGARNRFLIALMVALLLVTAAIGVQQLQQSSAAQTPTPTAEIGVRPEGAAERAAECEVTRLPGMSIALIGAAVLALGAAVYFAVQGYTWQGLRQERSFDLAIVLGTMVLPMLAPFLVRLFGLNPIDYTNSRVILLDSILITVLSVVAVAIGLLWNWQLWLQNAALFYGIFVVLYTSLFTNGFGFVTGLVGSLGYWLEQQGVNRGSQPGYYYALVQIPIYEFLPALGSLGALGMCIAGLFKRRPARQTAADDEIEPDPLTGAPASFDYQPIALFGFWSLTALLAYSLAGEKMPWLTVHIALPMILTAAWYLGRLVDGIDWPALLRQRGAWVVLLLPVFFLSLSASLGSLLGANPPFQGKELIQLQATSTFLTALITCALTGWGLVRLVRDWDAATFYRLIGLVFFSLLAVLTARAAFRASYINYDNATEYLVYAHMARGPKDALEQIEEISRRTTNGLALRIGYDDDTTYPYWWYLRDYTNKDFFGPNPTRAQRDDVAILVGDNNFAKIEPVVGQAYQMFEYNRIWWPNQDYFYLTWERLREAITNPQMRAAIFKIWLDRDYSLYAQVTNTDLSLPNWQPSHKFRLYVRKDVISSLWNYGVAPTAEEVIADPYEGKGITLPADFQIGGLGDKPGLFARPRGIAAAPDGTIYVADTENHRIQHLDSQGKVLEVWGSFAASGADPAPASTFNEPWGIAVGPDGSVFVADTWNHRIQKFSPSGEFLLTWGFGISQTDDPFGFYGPRAVAVDLQGRVFVTDTGNKRIVVFDSQGNYINKYGMPGLLPGEFDEPVGLAVDENDILYVADTWNQRIQAFIIAADGSFTPLLQWDVVGWYGQSLDNKPYLAADGAGHIFAADPEGYRILEFTTQGEFVRYWGDYGPGLDGFDLPGAVAVSADGGVWVTDVNNSRILRFTLPSQ